MITIKNLTKVYETINYNVVALSNLNFQFEKGEVVVVLGRSGSGKSTFLNVLGGFDNTYSGSYFFDKHEFKTIDQNQIDELRSKKIGFIFQHQVLFNNLTVLENIELSLNVLGVTNTKKKRLNAMKALTLVGLRRHAYKKPWQLSGGEKQRVAIARAIVKNPEVIICDEPTAALDSVTSKEILDLLASVCKNKLLIIATHNKSIVKNYGTRIIELKSGYVVRDELVKEDKSNIQVDELDKLVDEELYGEEEHVKATSHDDLVDKVDKSAILKDLELDLSQYKERSEETFHIDSNEKERVIKQRKEQVDTEERFDSFSGIMETMANEKRFARTSVFTHRKTYLFLSFFMTSFILFTIIGLNLSAGIFMKKDNTDEINHRLYKENHLIQFSPIDETHLFIDDTNLTEQKIKKQFINQTNLDPFSNKENEIILNDYSFNFRYHYDLYNQFADHLDANGYNNDFAMYYDPKNIVLGAKNDEIIFEDLQTYYEVVEGTNQLTMSRLLDLETEAAVSVLYSENNREHLTPFLIGDSRLPKEADEVLVSVETLINSGVLKLKNQSNVNEVYKQFKRLDDAQKVIEIKTPKMIMTLDDEDTLQVEETWTVNQFKIVGVYNAGEEIESFYTNKNHTKMFFSKAAQDVLTIQMDNRTEDYESYLIPLYMEVNNDIYKKQSLDDVLTSLQNQYLETQYEQINEVIKTYQAPLESAMTEISDYLKESTTLDLDKEVHSALYPELTYSELLQHYITNYLQLLNKDDQLALCSTCTFSNYDTLYAKVPDVYGDLEEENHLTTIQEGLTNPNSLAYERTISNILFTEYFSQFNNSYYIHTEGEVAFSNLKLSYSNDLKENSYHKLFTLAQSTMNQVDENGRIPSMSDTALKAFVLNAGRIYINPSIIVTGMSSFAANILVIVLMYVFVFILSKLFRNIYQLFLVNRRAEFGSLRILGAKFEDLKRIMKREGRILLFVSYGFVIAILLLIEAITFFTQDNSFVFYLYQPSNQLFINIRLADFFKFNIFSIISMFILMQTLFRKQLIDDNIDKNIKDLKMLKSITDWDGE